MATEFVPPTIDSPVLAEIIRRLVDTYHPERIYLFGSAARGESTPDSDYDLMVVVPNDMPAEQRDSGRAYHALWGVEAPADVLVWTQKYFDERLHLRASLPSTILREGRLVYVR
jgi:predicted nucleotidyltransferase